MLGAPLADTLHLVRSTEVVAVSWLATPTPLTGGFAGAATLGLAAVVLVTTVAVIREEELSAVEALTSAAF